MARKTDTPSIRDRVLEMRRVPASELLPNPRNWRMHNDAQRRIFREMLDRIGFAGAELARLLPDGRLMLIDGHMRQEEVGDTPLPVLVTDLTEQEADALLATFDPLGRLAGTDRDAASALIESLGAAGYDAAADLLRAVADNDQTAALLESLADGMLGDEPDAHEVDDPAGGGDDFDTTPDESGPTRCQSGDLWQLGDHRLLCGDSTKREDVARLMDGARADMVFTDPPYGVAYQTKLSVEEAAARHRRTDGLEVANDAMTPEQTARFLRTAFDMVREQVLRPGGAFYVCSPSGDMETIFRNALDAASLRLRECLVWVKDVFVMGRQDYHWRHESILYGWADGAAHYFVNDRTQDTVWEIARPRRSEDHPTMKPLALVAKALQNSSREREVVYDGFGGSGSTLIACERTKRTCRTIELDPRYCDVIIRRWEQETGRQAEKISCRDSELAV